MTKENKRKKLLKQILKFGVVGVLAFIIDFTVYSIVLNLVKWEFSYIPASIAGFTISLIFNYAASMKFVFQRKDGADKKKEFMIFMVLSLIGMGINTVVIWLCMDVIYNNWIWLQSAMDSFNAALYRRNFTFVENGYKMAAYFAKFIATGIVMVYNFISRKMTLEKKDDEIEENEQIIQEANII